MERMSTAGGDKTLREPFSLREKNLMFLGSILDALQIDTWRPDIDFASVKKAFTPTVVRKIHESLIQIWPDLDDYERCHAEDRKSVSGLYIGTYEPKPKIPPPSSDFRLHPISARQAGAASQPPPSLCFGAASRRSGIFL